MRLLGPYNSQLSAFHYQQLLALLEAALTQGDYEAGRLFNHQAAESLQAQGDSFADLSMVKAGQRAIAEEINHPLDLLRARYQALTAETGNFQDRLAQFLELLHKDSHLTEQILAVAEGAAWAAWQPRLKGAQSFTWDFGAGYGSIDTYFSQYDDYLQTISRQTYELASGLIAGQVFTGLRALASTRQVAVKQLTWDYATQGQSEVLGGLDWSRLTLLERQPLLTYGNPKITVSLPRGGNSAGIFVVSGQASDGSFPIYVRVLFSPRRRVMAVEPAVTGQTLTLSVYQVPVDGVRVYDYTQTYVAETDYHLTEKGVMTWLAPLNGKNVSVVLTEYYPAYQCSINERNWSPLVMLDADRPYPDTETSFAPVELDGSRFPLTDELGKPLGLYLEMVGYPTSEMSFRVDTPASNNYGPRVKLGVELERPSYLNGFHLTPFTNFPMRLVLVELEGFTSDEVTTVTLAQALLDRPLTIAFARQLVRKVYLTLFQENYSLKEHTVDPPDKLRRDTLASLQSVLPFAAQRTVRATPRRYQGAQYEFGLEDLWGEDSSVNQEGLFVAGPFRVMGRPELVRLDIQGSDPSLLAHVLCSGYDLNDVLVDTCDFYLDLSSPSGGTMVYASNFFKAAVVGEAAFAGAGLNDATSSGTYSGMADETLTVRISTAAATDKFQWKTGAGEWSLEIEITGDAQLGGDGVSITFGATTGHTVDDAWTMACTAIVEEDHVDFSVRFYLKDTPTSMLSRFLLQVTNCV